MTRRARIRSVGLARATRVAIVAAALALVGAAWSGGSEQAHAGVDLDEARRLFPAAAKLSGRAAGGGARVLDAAGAELGSVTRTGQAADGLIGYSGPSDVLLALDPDGRVRAARLIASGDTAAHAAAVANNAAFWRSLQGYHPADGAPRVEAVAGSTLTSLAIAEGVQLTLAGGARSLRFPDPLRLEEVRAVFPAAASLADEEVAGKRVLDADGATLGFALRTSPAADNVRGYGGPTEAWIALDPERREVVGVRLRASFDTPDYVERVRADARFEAELRARDAASWRALDSLDEAGVEGTSGATQTSWAVAEGVRRTLARAEVEPSGGRARDVLLGAITAGGLLLAFGPWRRRRAVRRAWQALLVVGFGFLLGDLFSLALIAGWARHGAPWREAPALVALAAVALVVPALTRRQVYCHHLCPHGVLQEWLARQRGPRRGRAKVDGAFLSGLRRLPALLLGIAFVLAVGLPAFELAGLEPFDAWNLGLAAGASAALFVVGLVASALRPMAYCRFACPSGALFAYLGRGGPRGERLGRRDALAAALVIACAPLALARAGGFDHDAPRTSAGGFAFGTTWSLRVRGGAPEPELLDAIGDELARIERELSAWSQESAVAAFSASGTTLPLEIPPELAELLARALEVSALTDGAFDVTVGPLVEAWSAGPAGERPPPNSAEVAGLLERVGRDKLALDRERGTLAKLHPDLRIDLGSLLQGYAADRASALCADRGHPEHLIEVGGELLARGRWRVAIEDPNGDGALRELDLEDAALATSGSYRHATHLVSPRTGQPIDAPHALVAVRAATGLEADLWATALFVSALGSTEAGALALEHGVELLAAEPRASSDTEADRHQAPR